MKKRASLTNRVIHSIVELKQAAVTGDVLPCVKGGGGPQPPDLYPGTHTGDPGPTS
jgi:hypothetical protein